MSNPATNVSDELKSKSSGLISYVNQIEKNNSKGNLSDLTVRRSYGGAFLSFYTNVENSLDDLFRGLLMERYKTLETETKPLVDINSENVAKRIIQGTRSYVDWLPIEKTIERAQSFFSQGIPFTKLNGTQKKGAFKEIRKIRNAIAHKSSHAISRFEKAFVESRSLPQNERNPKGFLRGLHRSNPDQTRFEFYIAKTIKAVTYICR